MLFQQHTCCLFSCKSKSYYWWLNVQVRYLGLESFVNPLFAPVSSSGLHQYKPTLKPFCLEIVFPLFDQSSSIVYSQLFVSFPSTVVFTNWYYLTGKCKLLPSICSPEGIVIFVCKVQWFVFLPSRCVDLMCLRHRLWQYFCLSLYFLLWIENLVHWSYYHLYSFVLLSCFCSFSRCTCHDLCWVWISDDFSSAIWIWQCWV